MINFLTVNAGTNWTLVWVVTIVGYVVVFLALLALVYFYKLIPEILNFQNRRRLKKSGKEVSTPEQKSEYMSGEVNAAIGMALVMFFEEQHDDESNIITIKRVERTYSPWSSKIYGTSHNVLVRNK